MISTQPAGPTCGFEREQAKPLIGNVAIGLCVEEDEHAYSTISTTIRF